MSEIADAVRALKAEKGIDDETVKQMIEKSLRAAYQKSFGKDYDNCIIKFADDLSEVNIYSRKTVVDGVYDPVIEIELEDAKKLAANAEIHDELDILLDPRYDFDRRAVSVGKQETHKNLSENSTKKLMDEYKAKIGQIIIGYYQREKNENIFVDLGKVEGYLPKKFRSPRETYEKNDRIKALVHDVKKNKDGVQIILSRTDEKFVKSILELEIPEIADNTITITNIAREAGYRTKVAVASNKPDVDPVGSCVGLKGVRITNVITELDGEKIDVLRYDEDPHVFITNALSPAKVKQVVIKDMEKKEALAIVSESDFSIAIGKQGMNVRLANKLCDWIIDVKTEAQVTDEDLYENNIHRAAEELFSGNDDSGAGDAEEIYAIGELPGIDAAVAEVLKEKGYEDIEKFVTAYESGQLDNLEGITREQLETVNSIINENVEFEDEEPEETSQETDSEEEEYLCPECGTRITLDMHKCPKCGIEFEFKDE